MFPGDPKKCRRQLIYNLPCAPITLLPYYFGSMKGTKKYQDVLRHPVRFGSMHTSVLLWWSWPTILCAAEYTTHGPTSLCIARRQAKGAFWIAFFGWTLQHFASFRLKGHDDAVVVCPKCAHTACNSLHFVRAAAVKSKSTWFCLTPWQVCWKIMLILKIINNINNN